MIIQCTFVGVLVATLLCLEKKRFIKRTFVGLSPSSAGLPTYPDPGMAAVLLGQLTDQTRLKLGIWDGLASGGSWGFSGNDVILLVGELEHKYSLYGERPSGIFRDALAVGLRFTVIP